MSTCRVAPCKAKRIACELTCLSQSYGRDAMIEPLSLGCPQRQGVHQSASALEESLLCSSCVQTDLKQSWLAMTDRDINVVLASAAAVKVTCFWIACMAWIFLLLSLLLCYR